MFKPRPGLVAVALCAAVTAVPAGAQHDDHGRYERAYGDGYRGGYDQPLRADRGDERRFDGRDRRYAPRRCDDGTTGTIIGAIAGGLLGRSIDTRGDRSLGTILGLGGGALAGRAVGRSHNPGWCR